MRMSRGALQTTVFAVIPWLLTSCGVRDGAPVDYDKPWHSIDNAVPKKEPKSRYGNPASYEQFGKRYHVLESSKGFVQEGIASWYGTKFHGERTSSGETYDMYAMTAAHKTLPLPTYVEVVNQDNGRRAIVKVNDRGPFHPGRIIDLSYAAAIKLGVDKAGTAKVRIRAIDPATHDAEEPAAAQQGVDDGKVYVQVAAFSSEQRALDMLQSLREANFRSARIHVERKQEKLLYRVRIGPLPSTDVAEELLSQLQKSEHHNAKIVTYN